jgi:hypothetical protein
MRQIIGYIFIINLFRNTIITIISYKITLFLTNVIPATAEKQLEVPFFFPLPRQNHEHLPHEKKRKHLRRFQNTYTCYLRSTFRVGVGSRKPTPSKFPSRGE